VNASETTTPVKLLKLTSNVKDDDNFNREDNNSDSDNYINFDNKDDSVVDISTNLSDVNISTKDIVRHRF
jgi:hypothetical protein